MNPSFTIKLILQNDLKRKTSARRGGCMQLIILSMVYCSIKEMALLSTCELRIVKLFSILPI